MQTIKNSNLHLTIWTILPWFTFFIIIIKRSIQIHRISRYGGGMLKIYFFLLCVHLLSLSLSSSLSIWSQPTDGERNLPWDLDSEYVTRQQHPLTYSKSFHLLVENHSGTFGLVVSVSSTTWWRFFGPPSKCLPVAEAFDLIGSVRVYALLPSLFRIWLSIFFLVLSSSCSCSCSSSFFPTVVFYFSLEKMLVLLQ